MDEFSIKGYLVKKDKDDTYLSLQKSAGAIGKPTPKWDTEPTADSIFTKLEDAREFAKQHDAKVIECELNVELKEPVN